MTSPVEVTDSQSNRPEHIVEAASSIGKSKQKRILFEAIYKHKKRARSVVELAQMTGLGEVRVLQLGGQLRADHIVDQHKKNGRVAYVQRPFFQRHKRKILALIDKPERKEKVSTKRNVGVSVRIHSPKERAQPRANFITVDDIDSFLKVRKVRSSAKSLPATMSERQFNDGVKSILGETGTFKDWGGETSDLFSSRLVLRGKRRRSAFGFKGPGLKVALVPSRLGKNGDQMRRLFSEPGDVFVIQHWREIRPSVIELMELYAERKARNAGRPIYYGVIDGHDSNRLRLAYLSHFRRRSTR